MRGLCIFMFTSSQEFPYLSTINETNLYEIVIEGTLIIFSSLMRTPC